MDEFTEDIRKEGPWDVMFANEIVLSKQNHRTLDEDVEIWEMHWRKELSWSKTECLKVGGADVGEELKLQEDVVKRVKISLVNSKFAWETN